MKLQTPKWAPTLEVGILMDLHIFKGRLQGSKIIGLNFFYIIKKLLKRNCLKWVRMTHLGT